MNKFTIQYLNIINQQNDSINRQIDYSKILTRQQLDQINEINSQIGFKRSSHGIDVSFFKQISERKPVLLLSALPTQKYKYFATGDFCGVPIDTTPWIPTISLFLQANSRTFHDEQTAFGKRAPKKNVFPIIYAPQYSTDQTDPQTFEKKKSDPNLDGYDFPDLPEGIWMPDQKSRSRACLILSYAYSLLGGINILVNEGGTLAPISIKDIWEEAGDNLMTRIYPEAIVHSSSLSNRLINDYFRNYGYRESKKIDKKRKLLLENKKRLLRKKK